MDATPLIPSLPQAVILGTQAILAAIVEERLALRADGAGFRNSNGEFVSKKRGILQAFLGVGGIAIVVQLVPFIATRAFPQLIVQTLGLAMLGTVGLIHEIVDEWKVSWEEQIFLLLGGAFLLVPFGAIGITVFILWLIIGGVVTHYNLVRRFDAPDREEVAEAVATVQDDPRRITTVIIVLVVEDAHADDVGEAKLREQDDGDEE